MTDHKLLVSKCVFSVKWNNKSTRSLKKLDTPLNDDKKAKLVHTIDEKISVCDTDFVELKDHMSGLMIRMRKFKLYFEIKTLTGTL